MNFHVHCGIATCSRLDILTFVHAGHKKVNWLPMAILYTMDRAVEMISLVAQVAKIKCTNISYTHKKKRNAEVTNLWYMFTVYDIQEFV